MSSLNGHQKMVPLLVLFVNILLGISIQSTNAFVASPTSSSVTALRSSLMDGHKEIPPEEFARSNKNGDILWSRRSAASAALTTLIGTGGAVMFMPQRAMAKCTDIESCREIGEKKIEQDMKDNPTTSLKSGVRYKVLRPGTGDAVVADGSSVDLVYSISEGGGAYMYSKGFGYEKINIGGKMQSDLGLDSLRIVVGSKSIPVGIEQALMGMKRGEKRRVELPPNVGFETSNWQPEPTSRRGKASIIGYKRILEGFGSQPPFPSMTIWDVEVLKTRN